MIGYWQNWNKFCFKFSSKGSAKRTSLTITISQLKPNYLEEIFNNMLTCLVVPQPTVAHDNIPHKTWTSTARMDLPDVAAYRARELPPPCVTCRLMNSRLVFLMDEPIRPHEPCVLTTFCLDTQKQSDTSGELGAQNPKEGQMVPRTEDRTHINMRKE